MAVRQSSLINTSSLSRLSSCCVSAFVNICIRHAAATLLGKIHVSVNAQNFGKAADFETLAALRAHESIFDEIAQKKQMLENIFGSVEFI